MIKLKSISRMNDKPLCRKRESGFSLIEATIALAIFLIAVLGVFTTFTYSVNYNAGNSARTQALAIIQRKVEELRSKKFTPTITDTALSGGEKAAETYTAPDGNRFLIEVTVDDDPFTAGVQTNTAKTLKEVTVTVTLDRPTPGWQTAVPMIVVLRRVRAN